MLFMLSTANIPDVLKSSRMTGVTYMLVSFFYKQNTGWNSGEQPLRPHPLRPRPSLAIPTSSTPSKSIPTSSNTHFVQYSLRPIPLCSIASSPTPILPSLNSFCFDNGCVNQIRAWSMFDQLLHHTKTFQVGRNFGYGEISFKEHHGRSVPWVFLFGLKGWN